VKVVSPFRPFAPESVEHLQLGPFDWPGALRMSMLSTEAVYGPGHWFALTDVDTDLSVPSFKFQTTHRRLMLWIVEVCLRYLESDEFDQDTLMLSPDSLLFGKVGKLFQGDLGVVVRLQQKFVDSGRVILNSTQLWRHAGKERLIPFYRRALAIAEQLPDNRIRWGGDTDPLIELLSPIISEGLRLRAGLCVNFIGEQGLMESVTEEDILAVASGRFKRTSALPICHFRYTRKHAMAAYFEATVGKSVAA